jgi:hypothetical protein
MATGEMDVDGVGGNFTVTVKKGNGAIRHKNVRGRISLPGGERRVQGTP